MENKVRACIEHLREENRLSNNTLTSYERDITQYTNYLSDKGIDLSDDSGRDAIDGYIQYLLEQGRSSSTVTRSIASIRIFYRYLLRNEHIKVNPIVGIEAPRVNQKTPSILSSHEVECLINQPGKSGVKNIRDQAILRLLYQTGMKVTELISVNINDADVQKMKITCKEGRKCRNVSMPAECMNDLNDYLKLSRPFLLKNSGERALFINSSGNRLSRQGIWKILKKYSRLANLQKEITPYTLRHTLAADLIKNGSDVNEVQTVLGNSTRSTLDKYFKMLGAES